MQRVLKISSLVSAALAAWMVLPASAQQVGNVISSTPVLKRVTEPPRGCVTSATRDCRSEMVTEDRLIGYKVVYEYQGRQHEVQLPFPVGATIPIEISGGGFAPAATPTVAAPMPTYEPTPRVVERVYVEPHYYASPRVYYDDPYYYAPVLPAVVGLAIGLGAAYHWGPRYVGPRGHLHYRGWRGR